MRTTRRLIVTLMLALAPQTLLGADSAIAVIVHPANPLKALSQADLMRLYLGKTRSFPDQSPARAVSLKDGVSPRREFDARVLDRTPNQVRAYWAQQIFTGRGTPPREFDSAEALRQFVATTPDAVGFVDASAADASVRTLLRLE